MVVRHLASAVTFDQLLHHAKESGAASSVFVRDAARLGRARAVFADAAQLSDAEIRVVDDQKYYLSKSPLAALPMTAAQATRLNADRTLLTKEAVLSPRQLALLRRIETHQGAALPSAIGVDVTTALRELERRLNH